MGHGAVQDGEAARQDAGADWGPRTGGQGRIGADTSQTIRIARVLCILCLVYMHAPPYGMARPEVPLSGMGALWFFRELVGRSSVPLLSVISGFLAVRLGARAPWRGMVGRKAATLLVPLLLWNLIGLAKIALETRGAGLPAPAELPDALLALTGMPLVTPTYFLRDVFLCALALPLLGAAAARAPWLALVLLLGNALFALDGALFLNGAIPLFFFVGMLVGTGRLSLAMPRAGQRRYWFAGILVLFAGTIGLAYAKLDWAGPLAGAVEGARLLVGRACGVALFWLAALRLRESRLAARIEAVEPFIFFIFCSHTFSIGIAWAGARAAGVEIGSPGFVPFFLLCPLFALIGGLVGATLLGVVAPRFLALLLGGRAPGPAQAGRVLAALVPARLARGLG